MFFFFVYNTLTYQKKGEETSSEELAISFSFFFG
jgi:hypothetical protein